MGTSLTVYFSSVVTGPKEADSEVEVVVDVLVVDEVVVVVVTVVGWAGAGVGVGVGVWACNPAYRNPNARRGTMLLRYSCFSFRFIGHCSFYLCGPQGSAELVSITVWRWKFASALLGGGAGGKKIEGHESLEGDGSVQEPKLHKRLEHCRHARWSDKANVLSLSRIAFNEPVLLHCGD
jgi:hypothetical protein